MKVIARWAWVLVLGTALALSWWSLDALARHYGVPSSLAAIVSVTFDGAALVAADLAIRRAQAADSAGAVKLLMVLAVGLSAWLNYEHGALLHYPLPIRVLFASPSVIGGWLFELQLRSWHRVRLRELGRLAEPLPRFGALVWLFHPTDALRKVSQIAGSRLQSIPVSVLDWDGAPPRVRVAAVAVPRLDRTSTTDGSGAIASEHASLRLAQPDDGTRGPTDTVALPGGGPGARPKLDERRSGRTPLPDAPYVAKLREHVATAGGVIPSARETAKLLSIGQDRARRLVRQLKEERDGADKS